MDVPGLTGIPFLTGRVSGQVREQKLDDVPYPHEPARPRTKGACRFRSGQSIVLDVLQQGRNGVKPANKNLPIPVTGKKTVLPEEVDEVVDQRLRAAGFGLARDKCQIEGTEQGAVVVRVQPLG